MRTQPDVPSTDQPPTRRAPTSPMTRAAAQPGDATVARTPAQQDHGSARARSGCGEPGHGHRDEAVHGSLRRQGRGWLVELLLTVVATAVLLVETPTIGSPAGAARTVAVPRGLPGSLAHSLGGLVVLLLVLALSVYKPTGVTRYGWRKQQEQRRQPDAVNSAVSERRCTATSLDALTRSSGRPRCDRPAPRCRHRRESWLPARGGGTTDGGISHSSPS